MAGAQPEAVVLLSGGLDSMVAAGIARERGFAINALTIDYNQRHRQSGCSRVVVQDGADEVVVQYTCRGNGYGRTSIRREGNSLVQIRSQGIQGGTPFSFSAEARHSGSC